MISGPSVSSKAQELYNRWRSMVERRVELSVARTSEATRAEFEVEVGSAFTAATASTALLLFQAFFLQITHVGMMFIWFSFLSPNATSKIKYIRL